MADIVTGTTTGQVDDSAALQGLADARRENAFSEANVRRDILAATGDAREAGALAFGGTLDAVKTAGWANSDRTGTEADRLAALSTAYFIATTKDHSDLGAAVAQNRAEILLQGERNQAATQLAVAQSATAAALATALVGQTIVADGNNTRALINALNTDNLNRQLIERNAEIVECRGDGRYWQGQFNNSQYSQLVSQVNALNSQMTETRQGMVNFGTMAGVGQSSTSNNVR